MIHGKFAVTTDIYFPHRCKSYNSSTVARVIYSTQSGKISLVNGPQSFSLRLLHLKPKLSLSFPFLFPLGSFFLSYPYFSVGYKVTSSPVLRNINGTPCSFDTSLELFLSPDRVRIQERLCLPNSKVTVALAFKPNKTGHVLRTCLSLIRSGHPWSLRLCFPPCYRNGIGGRQMFSAFISILRAVRRANVARRRSCWCQGRRWSMAERKHMCIQSPSEVRLRSREVTSKVYWEERAVRCQYTNENWATSEETTHRKPWV